MPRGPTAKPASRAVAVAASIPAAILRKLRGICLRLPDASEEKAWVGIRWMVRKRNFAHVVKIDQGHPPAYARAAGSDGPLVVLTFRASPALRDVLQSAGSRYFVAAWGTTWATKVIGLKLSPDTDWNEVKTLLTESHRVLTPQPRAAKAKTPSKRKPRKRKH